MLKKKYIAIISISTAGLLFASLIFTAITTFPELLEPEEEKEQKADENKAIANRGGAFETHITFDEPANDEEVVIVISNKAPKDVVIDVYENSYVDNTKIAEEPVAISNAVEPTKPEVQEDETTLIIDPKANERVAETATIVVDISEAPTIEEAPIIEIEEVVEPTLEENENVHYMSLNRYEESYHALNDEEESPKLDAPNKAVNVTIDHKAHYEVIECTMLVIGVINVLSFLFVKRRKRRTYHI